MTEEQRRDALEKRIEILDRLLVEIARFLVRDCHTCHGLRQHTVAEAPDGSLIWQDCHRCGPIRQITEA